MPSQNNRMGRNTNENPLNDSEVTKRVKMASETNMTLIQNSLTVAFLYKNPNGTVSEFGRFYNSAIKEIR